MSDFAFGLFVAWLVIAYWPQYLEVVGAVAVTLLLFCAGWNWRKFATKKGWTKP